MTNFSVMSDEDQALFEQLIVAASKLATISDNAAVILSSEYDDMVRPSIEEVRAIIAQCPQPQGQFDGKLYDDDIIETYFNSPSPVGEARRGVSLKHRITGIERQSYTKPTDELNRATAYSSLEKAVMDRYNSMSR